MDHQELSSILTIEDYLNLSGWKYSPRSIEGQVGDYHWFRSADLFFDFQRIIRLPKDPFVVSVGSSAWFENPANQFKRYAKNHDWEFYDYSVVSKLLTDFKFSELPQGVTVTVFDHKLEHSQFELLRDFELPEYLEDFESESTRKIWQTIQLLNPLICYSTIYEDGPLLFISRTESYFGRIFEACEPFARKSTSAYRANLWDQLGPECGPEKCVETACDNLRIKLAIRCFMHQLQNAGRLN